MDPAGMETGLTGMRPVPGASVPSSGPAEVGHVMPGDLRQPCLLSEAHIVHPPGMDVQSMGAPAPCPVVQGDQVESHKWVRNPSCVSGLSSIPLTPDVGQDGFIAEAQGTCHAIHVAQKVLCVTGASASSSGQPSQVSNASAESKSKRPLFKLDKYDGSTSLDTYLWKFNQLAEYLQWDERDKFYNLCASLDGPAGQVLRELSTNRTTGELEDLLQARFGTQKQAVSFQAKLRARRRAENATLQDLHRDISCLVQLAQLSCTTCSSRGEQ